MRREVGRRRDAFPRRLRGAGGEVCMLSDCLHIDPKRPPFPSGLQDEWVGLVRGAHCLYRWGLSALQFRLRILTPLSE